MIWEITRKYVRKIRHIHGESTSSVKYTDLKEKNLKHGKNLVGILSYRQNEGPQQELVMTWVWILGDLKRVCSQGSLPSLNTSRNHKHNTRGVHRLQSDHGNLTRGVLGTTGSLQSCITDPDWNASLSKLPIPWEQSTFKRNMFSNLLRKLLRLVHQLTSYKLTLGQKLFPDFVALEHRKPLSRKSSLEYQHTVYKSPDKFAFITTNE